jgi:hypothetical protein
MQSGSVSMDSLLVSSDILASVSLITRLGRFVNAKGGNRFSEGIIGRLEGSRGIGDPLPLAFRPGLPERVALAFFFPKDRRCRRGLSFSLSSSGRLKKDEDDVGGCCSLVVVVA